MTQPDSVLKQLVAAATWQPDWQAVLVRAGILQRRRLLTRRRLVVAVVVAVAVIVPLTAAAAARDWWFFRTPGSPTQTSSPVVVKTGIWEGHRWKLVAYPSETDGLCVSMIPGSGDSSFGAAMGCGPVEGVARTAQTKPGADGMKITYLAGSATSVLPAYIVGPVIESAATVAIRLSDGITIDTPTFTAPFPLDHVRFYIVQLPGKAAVHLSTFDWVAGLDQSGRVVACLARTSSTNGISPLSACH
jgi:hypothetical protein